MRHVIGWMLLALVTCGCDGGIPVAPTQPPMPTPPASAFTGQTGGDWRVYSFMPWHPAVGTPLALNTAVTGTVDANELCVPDIYEQWGARACERFVVTVPSDGWLDALLNWDASTPGFDLRFAGEVVLVAVTGQFAPSDLHKPAVRMAAPVVAGTYDVLVLSYAQEVPLRFQLELRFREN